MTDIQNLIATLRGEGCPDQDISSIVELLTRSALLKATQQIMDFTKSSLPEVKALEGIADQAEGEKKLQEIFEKHTGKSLDQLATEKLNEAARDYLAQRERITSQD